MGWKIIKLFSHIFLYLAARFYLILFSLLTRENIVSSRCDLLYHICNKSHYLLLAMAQVCYTVPSYWIRESLYTVKNCRILGSRPNCWILCIGLNCRVLWYGPNYRVLCSGPNCWVLCRRPTVNYSDIHACIPPSPCTRYNYPRMLLTWFA